MYIYIYTYTYVSLSLSIYIYICICVYLSIYLSIYLSNYLVREQLRDMSPAREPPEGIMLIIIMFRIIIYLLLGISYNHYNDDILILGITREYLLITLLSLLLGISFSNEILWNKTFVLFLGNIFQHFPYNIFQHSY